MDKTKQHINWIDIARTIAIMCVVVNHAVEESYDFQAEVIGGYSIFSRIFAFGGFTVGRLGVPIFLMITGILLLDREWNREKCIIFWKKNWFRLFICTEIWWIIYDVFIYFEGEKNISLFDVIQHILFVKNVDFPHVWYMNMILGMYILIPFVSMVLNKVDLKLLLFPIGFYLFFFTLIPIMNTMVLALKGAYLTTKVSSGFSGGEFGLYIIWGFIIAKLDLNKINNLRLAVISIVSYLLVVVLQIWCLSHGLSYKIWYNNGLLFAIAIPFVIILSRIEDYPKYLKFFCQSVAKHSFGIYLLHELVLQVVKKFITIEMFSYSVCCVIRFFVVFLLSWLGVTIISKIPKVGKFVFNER